MSYRVLENPNVPRGMEQVYAAQAVAAAEARAETERARREAESLRREQQRATLEALNAERIKREETAEREKREREAKRFEDDLRAVFFAGNPGADESDWARNRRAILDEAMRERAAGGGPVSAAKTRLLQSGRYSSL